MKKEQPNNCKRQLEPMPNYIMFDGEGNYGRKQLQDLDHKNLKVQINLHWKGEENVEEQNKNCETENKQILPKILNLKKSQDVEPMKTTISIGSLIFENLRTSKEIWQIQSEVFTKNKPIWQQGWFAG
ncbi:unnamed protein product (macronuclear) [Paramecium tetraurelia]|uniref:Uncharacterized protein n=1 Tax=Paramecium tetraurelia TaxID=5888 RepID=A0CQB8_PARTE|nr:uncharacterized protein GSPATT00009333001 [Paramecium tetraurelia]CAK72985.1 unnamed protein product [Paramecium tetraurelia]|eukprot:XP_001440382.1 hypothetical protein (macronuclear) [Paramecium tetraurelia strain d4-2]